MDFPCNIQNFFCKFLWSFFCKTIFFEFRIYFRYLYKNFPCISKNFPCTLIIITFDQKLGCGYGLFISGNFLLRLPETFSSDNFLLLCENMTFQLNFDQIFVKSLTSWWKNELNCPSVRGSSLHSSVQCNSRKHQLPSYVSYRFFWVWSFVNRLADTQCYFLWTKWSAKYCAKWVSFLENIMCFSHKTSSHCIDVLYAFRCILSEFFMFWQKFCSNVSLECFPDEGECQTYCCVVSRDLGLGRRFLHYDSAGLVWVLLSSHRVVLTVWWRDSLDTCNEVVWVTSSTADILWFVTTQTVGLITSFASVYSFHNWCAHIALQKFSASLRLWIILLRLQNQFRVYTKLIY